MIGDLGAAILRRLPPETSHRLALRALSLGGRIASGEPLAPSPTLQTEFAGLRLPNPIGLAAGFDKDAEAADALLALGFGWVECGTITPQPQPGNPTPRLFRLRADRAVINRFGFNSAGLDAAAARLRARAGRPGVVGANLGANKDAPDRIADYVAGLRRLWGLADYFTINISSPNTPGLRGLQDRAALSELLGRVEDARRACAGETASPPVFLKIAPDLEDDQIPIIVDAVREYGIDGLIVSNTTLARPKGLRGPSHEQGGLSGRPLFDRSTELLALAYQAAAGRLPLIGVGGVESGATAYAKIRAGASAVQLYTALIYEGPSLVRRICADLADRLKADGFASVAEAVGSGER